MQNKNYKIIFKLNIFVFLLMGMFLICNNDAQADYYYLDAINGNDANSGNISEPWQTLSKAKANVLSGDTIYLRSGDYGGYSESDVARTDYITYQAANGANVHFDRIGISGTLPVNSFLKFIGINIKPDWVDPCAGGNLGCEDPQYAESTQETYSKTYIPVNIDNASYIQVVDSVIEGQSRHLTTAGVYATHANYILISGCDIKNVTHAIRFISSCTNCTVYGNEIHHIAGTGINTVGTGYLDMLYENNHIYDGIYSESEDYAPRADGANVHGSGISIRDGNTTIRGNIIHDTGSSSGIMLYEDDAGNDYVNENVLIENNLIYDIHNAYVLRMYDTGPNVVVRNNTFIANSRYEVNDGYYQYRTALAIHSLDEQNGPASVDVYNNIMIGIAGLNSPVVSENNNIVWSYAGSGGWKCTGDPSIGDTDYVFTCTYANRSSLPLFKLFSIDPNMTFVNGHGLTLDFTATPNLIVGYPFAGSEIGYQYPIASLRRGDVDNSGAANTTDALLTLRNSLGLSMTSTVWQTGATTGDVDCSGSSNSTDALLIMRFSLGLGMDGTDWCE